MPLNTADDLDLDFDLDEDLQASHHRWLLSYADLVTLLFSLFVVLFSSAYVGQKKSADIAKGVRDAFGEHSPAIAISKPLKLAVDPALAPVKNLLEDRLKQAIESGKTEIRIESRGLVIRLKDVSVFKPGDTGINPEAHQIIDRIARAIAPLPNLITVEGHSDATAIHNSRFRDNWELSAARGVSMLRYLSETYGIPPQRLSATAFADTRPLSDNTSATGRAQNRRVDIVILSEAPELTGAH
jgi:chemotaxis protein MotB